MRLIKTAILFTLIAALFGCGSKSIRQETKTSISQKIVEGKTAKSEIESMFGLPKLTSIDGELEVWEYESSEPIVDMMGIGTSVDLPGGGTIEIPNVRVLGETKKMLNIIFDKNGVVNKYSMSEATTEN